MDCFTCFACAGVTILIFSFIIFFNSVSSKKASFVFAHNPQREEISIKHNIAPELIIVFILHYIDKQIINIGDHFAQQRILSFMKDMCDLLPRNNYDLLPDMKRWKVVNNIYDDKIIFSGSLSKLSNRYAITMSVPFFSTTPLEIVGAESVVGIVLYFISISNNENKILIVNSIEYLYKCYMHGGIPSISDVGKAPTFALHQLYSFGVLKYI